MSEAREILIEAVGAALDAQDEGTLEERELLELLEAVEAGEPARALRWQPRLDPSGAIARAVALLAEEEGDDGEDGEDGDNGDNGDNGVWYVWGTGPPASNLVAHADAADEWPAAAAGAEWCCVVEAAEADIDAATRFDRAVAGYAPVPEGAAQEWVDEGFGADAVEAWLRAGCWSADAAVRLRSLGVTPEQASARVAESDEDRAADSIGRAVADDQMLPERAALLARMGAPEARAILADLARQDRGGGRAAAARVHDWDGAVQAWRDDAGKHGDSVTVDAIDRLGVRAAARAYRHAYEDVS